MPIVLSRFGLTLTDTEDLFGAVPEADITPRLSDLLVSYLPLALMPGSEKSRSEFLIAPLLGEFKLVHRDRVGLFTGTTFDVEPESGLNGRCDYILTRSPIQVMITAPVCVAVEAKNENLTGGLPQCAAEMVAAQRFNGDEGTVFGAVTSGTDWRFLRLTGKAVAVDSVVYSIRNPRKIFGLLTRMVLGEAPASAPPPPASPPR